jgi:HEAT repeat protein
VTTAGERRRAAALAGHTGDLDTALHALTDPDEHVRATALGALERLGEVDDHVLAQCLTDPSPVVRRRAAEVAAHHPGTSLAALLDDEDPATVEVAAWACGEQAAVTPDVRTRLATLATGHDDALVREAAVAALGAIGHEDGLPAILTATRDKATVRRRAVLALAPFEGPEVDAALERARTDRDWQVRQAAEDLLGEPDPQRARR